MYAHVARQAGLGVSLSYIGRGINEEMPGLVVRKVIRALERAGKSPEEASFFLIGFAFKGEPETSDVRNSTTLDILALIKPVAREIRGYDPVVSAEEIGSFGVEAVTLEEGFKGADCVLVLNNHRSYADMDFYANLRSMNRPAVYCDTWRIFAPGDAQQVDGITYVGLGFMS